MGHCSISSGCTANTRLLPESSTSSSPEGYKSTTTRSTDISASDLECCMSAPSTQSELQSARISNTDCTMIIAGIFSINIITSMDSSATTTIQPQVLTEYNALTKTGAISIATYLLVASLRPLFAKISDVFGHLSALALALSFHTIGLIVCSASQQFSELFAGTLLASIGRAGYGAIVAIVIADMLPLHVRGTILACAELPALANYYVGAALGQSLITQWRAVYAILAVLAVVCVTPALCGMYRAEQHSTKRVSAHAVANISSELDLVGLVLLSSGFSAVLFPLALQYNAAYGWCSVRVVGPVGVGLCVLAYFVHYERRVAKHPVVPFRLFAQPTFVSAVCASTLFFFTANAALYFFGSFIQVTREVNSRTAMFLQLGSTTYQVGAVLGGWAMQRTRRYRRWAWVGWGMWLASVLLMLRTRGSSSTSNLEIAAVQAVWGVGSGVVVGCVGIGVQAAVADPSDLAIAVTLYGMSAYLGGVLGEGLSTTIWVNVLPPWLEARLPEGVDVDRAVNSLEYFFALPKHLRVIVQEGYVHTQRILTICGICSMLAAGLFMLGLAPFDLKEGNQRMCATCHRMHDTSCCENPEDPR